MGGGGKEGGVKKNMYKVKFGFLGGGGGPRGAPGGAPPGGAPQGQDPAPVPHLGAVPREASWGIFCYNKLGLPPWGLPPRGPPGGPPQPEKEPILARILRDA
jgi:hypothetical protein